MSRIMGARRLFLVVLACLGALLVVVPAQAQPGKGDDFPMLPAHCQSVYKPLPFTPCQVTDFGANRPTVVVWGDSHAWMYQIAYQRVAESLRLNLVMVIEGGCPPAIAHAKQEGEGYSECEQRDRDVFAWIKQLAQDGTDFKLIVNGFWAGYRLGYQQTHDPLHPRTQQYTPYDRRLIELAHDGTAPLFRRLARLGVDTDVIAQAATVPPKAPSCAAGQEPYECDLSRTKAMHDEKSNHNWLVRMITPLDHPLIIDPSPAYCDATVCHPKVKGTNTWYDAIHLGKGLTKTMAAYFRPSFAELLDR